MSASGRNNLWVRATAFRKIEGACNVQQGPADAVVSLPGRIKVIKHDPKTGEDIVIREFLTNAWRVEITTKENR